MRRTMLALAVVLTASMFAATAVAQSSVPALRLAGPDRIATAIAISKHGFPAGSEEVYLSNRDVNPDALVGGTLTKGPILLVPQCGTLPAAVATEIRRLAPHRVYALGGPVVVCDEMLRQAAGAAPAPGTQPSPSPSPDPSPSPSPSSESVTVTRGGDGQSESFPLAGGSYKVTYDYGGDCYYGPFLEPVGDDGSPESLPSGSGPTSGEAFVHNVEAGTYYVDMITGPEPGCPWTITLTK